MTRRRNAQLTQGAAVGDADVAMNAVEALKAEVTETPQVEIRPAKKGRGWTEAQREQMRATMKAKYDPESDEGKAERDKRKAEADAYWQSEEGKAQAERNRVEGKDRYEAAKAVADEQES